MTMKQWRSVSFDLIFTMNDIFINSDLVPLTKLSSSRRNCKFKDILSWNISQLITKMKKSIPFWAWRKVNGNRQFDLNFPMEGKLLWTNTRVRRNKSKRGRLWELSRKLDLIWVARDRKIITGLQFLNNRSTSPYDGR